MSIQIPSSEKLQMHFPAVIFRLAHLEQKSPRNFEYLVLQGHSEEWEHFARTGAVNGGQNAWNNNGIFPSRMSGVGDDRGHVFLPGRSFLGIFQIYFDGFRRCSKGPDANPESRNISRICGIPV